MDTILALQRGVFLVDLMPSSIKLKILYKFIYKVYVIILTVILQPFLTLISIAEFTSHLQ